MVLFIGGTFFNVTRTFPADVLLNPTRRNLRGSKHGSPGGTYTLKRVSKNRRGYTLPDHGDKRSITCAGQQQMKERLVKKLKGKIGTVKFHETFN